MAAYLIQQGADLTQRDFEGKLPMELTEDDDLLDCKSCVNRCDMTGRIDNFTFNLECF